MKAITTGAGDRLFPTLAASLAYDTDFSVDQAAAVFEAVMQDVETEAAAPAPAKDASASPKGDAFRKAMANEAPNPPLGSGGGKAAAEADDPWIAAAKDLGFA